MIHHRTIQCSSRAAVPPNLLAVLQSLSEPLLVLDAGRQVHFANAAAIALLKEDDGLSLRGATLIGEDRELHDRLVQSMADTAAGAPGQARTMLMRQRFDGRCAVLHLSLLGDGQTGDDARIIARVCANAALLAPDMHAVKDAFGLSQAEAEIAQLIAAGYSPRRIANKRLVSQETVRWHIKNIYSKTSTSRLVDLVQQLCAARSPFFDKTGAGSDDAVRPAPVRSIAARSSHASPMPVA